MDANKFKSGFIKAATAQGISLRGAATLYKIAGPWWETLVKSPIARNSFNIGAPLAIGTGTGLAAHEAGAGPGISIASGIGAASAADPRHWANVLRATKASEEPLTHFSDAVLKGLLRKSLPVGAVAGLGVGIDASQHVPSILRHMENVTGNADAISQAGSKAAPEIAKNITSASGNIAEATKQVPDVFADIHEVTSNNSRLMHGLTEQLGASGETLKTLADSSKGIANTTAQVGGSLNKTIRGINSIPEHLSQWGQNLSEGYQHLPSAGKAGVIGGGSVVAALLLKKLLQSNKPARPKRQTLEY